MPNGVVVARRLCVECHDRPVMLGKSGLWSAYCSRTCKRRAKNRRRRARQAAA
jgi:hypothetical protein